MFKKTKIKCNNCGYEGKAKSLRKTAKFFFTHMLYLILAIMFCWTIVAPIIYFKWFFSNVGKKICPQCRSHNVKILNK